MATDREIGDLVARFRMIVDQQGTKEATLALDNLEKKAARSSRAVEASSANASKGMKGLVGTATLAAATVVKLADRFLDLGEAGKLSGKDQEQYLRLDSATTALTDSVGGLATELAVALTPSLITVADLTVSLIGFIEDLGDETSNLGKIFKLLEDIGPAGGKINRDFYGLDKAAEKATGGARELARMQRELAASSALATKIISDQEKAFRELIDAQVAELDAQLDVRSADLAVAGALAKLEVARKKAGESSKRGTEFLEREADALEAVRDAQDAVTDARFKATRSADDLGEAQEALAVAQFEFGPGSYEAAEAGDDLAEAQHALDVANRDVGESIEDVASRQRDYNAALKDGYPTAAEMADAQRDVAKAEIAVDQAALNAAKSAAGLTSAQALANGVMETGAERATSLQEALRNYGVFAASPAFAAQMAARDAAIGGILPMSGPPGSLQESSIMRPAPGVKSVFDDALSVAGQPPVGTTVINNIGPVYANDPADAAATLSREIDWVSRRVT